MLMHIAWPTSLSTISYGAILAVAGMLTPGATASADTLEDSILSALNFNPEVGVVQSDRRAIDQELRQARALYMPSVDLRAAIGPEFTNSTGTRARDSRPPGGDASAFLTRMESQLTLTQMLFDGYATDSEVAKQLARTNSAAYRVSEAAEFIALDAIEAHLDVLRNQELVRQAEQNLAAHQTILGRLREDTGFNRFKQSELNLSEARHAAGERGRGPPPRAICAMPRRASCASPESNRRNWRTGRHRDMACPGERMPRRGVRSTTARRSRSRTADIDVARAELKGSRAGYYPRFEPRSRGGCQPADRRFHRQQCRRPGPAGDALQSLPRRRRHRARARGLLAPGPESGNAEESTERGRGAGQGFLQCPADRGARVLALSRQTDANARTRRGFSEEFDAGERNLLDRLDVENEYYLSKANLTTAEYTRDFAVYRVLAVTGDLLPTLDIDHPKESINIWRERTTEE